MRTRDLPPEMVGMITQIGGRRLWQASFLDRNNMGFPREWFGNLSPMARVGKIAARGARLVRDAAWPYCSVCNKRLFFRSDKAADLQRLKPLGEYEAAYDAYKHLCQQCWTKITTVQCDLCQVPSDVFAFDNQIDRLRQNLTKHSVELGKVSSTRHVCKQCCEQRLHCACSRCLKPFLLPCDAANQYRSNADIPRWLAPYHKDHLTTVDHLCPECFKDCLASRQDVETRLSQWIDGTRDERIRDFRTVKRLGRVEYDGTECNEPAKLKDRLQLYAVQLGGNAFVDYYGKVNEECHYDRVLGGHGPRGNPYYKTVTRTTRCFTGTAMAVIVEPFAKQRAALLPMADGPVKPTHLVLDGLNICHWASRVEPDLRILLAIVLELAQKKLPFLTFFDANTPHVLRERDAVAYKRLVGDLPRIFVEVTGRMRADEFILQSASRDNSHVISNDQFRDFSERYPWVLAGDRLIKGAVAGDRVLVPRLDINLRITPDAEAVTDVLVKTIALESSVHGLCTS